MIKIKILFGIRFSTEGFYIPASLYFDKRGVFDVIKCVKSIDSEAVADVFDESYKNSPSHSSFLYLGYALSDIQMSVLEMENFLHKSLIQIQDLNKISANFDELLCKLGDRFSIDVKHCTPTIHTIIETQDI